MVERYIVANGIRLYAVEDGTGPLVLLCHGFPESWYSWRHQIGPLARAGYRVVAIDLPGYGRSDKPDVRYDVAWVNACLADLIRELGHENAVLAGHDWGGLLVWPFARRYPEHTAGVIGVNTPDLPRGEKPPVAFMRETFGDRNFYILQFQQPGEAEFVLGGAGVDGFLEAMFLGPATVRKEVFTPEVIETYARDFRPLGALTPPLDYYRQMDRNWELTRDLAGVRCEVPCLQILAEGDPVLHPGLAEGMEERVPDLEKVLISDCGHWTQQEQPERTTDAMLAYLERLEPWD